MVNIILIKYTYIYIYVGHWRETLVMCMFLGLVNGECPCPKTVIPLLREKTL